MEEVDLAGLKKETARQILRAFKKAGKAEERLRKLLERDAAGPASSDAASAATKTPKTSEADGDGAVEELVALETERDELQERLRKLNDLEARLQVFVCVFVCVCVCVRERERERVSVYVYTENSKITGIYRDDRDNGSKANCMMM